VKLLSIVEYFPSSTKIDVRGGIEIRSYFIAKHLVKAHQVAIITSSEVHKPIFQKLSKIEVHRVGALRNYTSNGQIIERLFFMFSAVKLGLSLDFDIVEGAGFFGWLPAFFLACIKGKKSVMLVADTINEYAVDTEPWVLYVLKMYEKLFLNARWNLIICISHTVEKKVIKLLSHSQKIVVVYCGVGIGQIDQIKKKSLSQTQICCIARLVSYKHVEDLIYAAQQLKNKYNTNFRLAIIGDGKEYPNLQLLSQKLLPKHDVIFYRFVRDHRKVLQILKNSYIFCLPSTVEGFGISTIEALACGVPAIVADIPINHEVTHDRGAMFFQSENPKDLCNKMYSLLINKSMYRRLKNETKKIAKRYDWQAISEQTEKLYSNLLTH
jgi:glycosyltransferase involved in cell wall biosynthesis